MSVIAVVLSYFVGAIPTGLWLGLVLKRVDIREHGSHNIGATNTMRVLGEPLGAVALAVDILKGLVAVSLIAAMAPWSYGSLVCGLAAILGHVTSPFVRFRGGKGVATSAGVFLGLAPLPTVIAAVVFGAVLALTRMVSAGSISAAIALAIAVCALSSDRVLQLLVIVVAILVIFRHRSNIHRILSGTENRV